MHLIKMMPILLVHFNQVSVHQMIENGGKKFVNHVDIFTWKLVFLRAPNLKHFSVFVGQPGFELFAQTAD